MSSHLARKLERFARLSAADKEALFTLTRRPLRNIPRGQMILREGETSPGMRIFLSGWSYRCKSLEGGRRQIVSFLLPGDVCDLNACVLSYSDHSIVAATQVTVVDIPRQNVEDIAHGHPALFQALCWDEQVSVGLLREWIINIGQRTALERMANLFCELFVRLDMVGLTNERMFSFPVTQADLAAATGLSTVHVNRTLQELRRAELVSLTGRGLHILDFPRLKRLAQFRPNYLHLGWDYPDAPAAPVEPAGIDRGTEALRLPIGS